MKRRSEQEVRQKGFRHGSVDVIRGPVESSTYLYIESDYGTLTVSIGRAGQRVHIWFDGHEIYTPETLGRWKPFYEAGRKVYPER